MHEMELCVTIVFLNRFQSGQLLIKGSHSRVNSGKKSPRVITRRMQQMLMILNYLTLNKILKDRVSSTGRIRMN